MINGLLRSSFDFFQHFLFDSQFAVFPLFRFYQSKYFPRQFRADPHHLTAVSEGQGFPPRFGCLRIFLWRMASPIPQLLEQVPHSSQSDTLQSLGGPERR